MFTKIKQWFKLKQGYDETIMNIEIYKEIQELVLDIQQKSSGLPHIDRNDEELTAHLLKLETLVKECQSGIDEELKILHNLTKK